MTFATWDRLFVDVEQAAYMVGMSEDWVLAALKAGVLSGSREVGRETRVLRRSIDELTLMAGLCGTTVDDLKQAVARGEVVLWRPTGGETNE